MSSQNFTLVLPGGGTRAVSAPADMTITEMLAELTRELSMPFLGPDAATMIYSLESKTLRRTIEGAQTLAAAGVPEGDRLLLTTQATAGAAPSSVAESPRMRRLRGDYELMQELAGRANLISFVAQSPRPNLPPERYIVTFKCKSIGSVDRQGNPLYSDHHQVEIYLHNQYPQRWPGMKWLTPIWHPNINHLNGSVCIDAAWWTASRSLDRLVIMLGEMLQYKNYHDDPTKPPFPWDPEAARWSREYRKKHPNICPVDTRELMRPERVKLNEGHQPVPKKPGIRLSPQIKSAHVQAVPRRAASQRAAAPVKEHPVPHTISVQIKPGSAGMAGAPARSAVIPKPKIRIK